MKMNKLTTLLLIIAVYSSACNVSYKSVPISSTENSEKGIVYNLPKTEVIVNVEVTEIHSFKGPFAAFAGKYFGNVDAENADDVDFQISNIQISTVPIPDSTQYYELTTKGLHKKNTISLTEQGFIAGINSVSDYSKSNESNSRTLNLKTNSDKISYAELALRSVRETAYDTTYKEVFRDSVIVREPVITQRFVYKTPEKQAQELADIIFLLRDDRNALLKGENDGDHIPDGAALEIMIRELNKLEKEYMALFTGHKTTNLIKYEFRVIPQLGDSALTVFRFSENFGILPTNTTSGAEVQLVFQTPQQFDSLRYTNTAGIKYRTPATVNIAVMYEKKKLTHIQTQLNQFGVVRSLPKKLRKGSAIEFYPESGMLKSIFVK